MRIAAHHSLVVSSIKANAENINRTVYSIRGKYKENNGYAVLGSQGVEVTTYHVLIWQVDEIINHRVTVTAKEPVLLTVGFLNASTSRWVIVHNAVKTTLTQKSKK